MFDGFGFTKHNDETSKISPFSKAAMTPYTHNWTNVPMYYFAIIFVPIFYFIFSSSRFRSKHWEIFYTTHVYASIVFVIMTMWHASQAHRFLIPALGLYFIDRCLRFWNSTKVVSLENIVTYKCGETRVTQLEFSEASYEKKLGTGQHARQRNKFSMGQFYYIHIPSISAIEWHPFSVSCSDFYDLPTLHIKVEFYQQNGNI